MRLPSQILLLTATLLATSTTVHAQKGRSGEDSEHREVHRSLSVIEAEMRALIDQNEAYIRAAADRSSVLRKLQSDLNKADGKQRQKVNQQILDLSFQEKEESLTIGLNGITMQRLQLEMDNLNRYDAHLIEDDDDHSKPGFRQLVRAPQIKSITVLKEERGAPTRVTGVGFGSYTTKLYEIVFSDGSRQRVESKEFTPTQRR